MVAPIQNVKGTTPTAALVATLREIEKVVDSWGYVITLFYGSTTWADHDNRRCGDIMTSSARKKLPNGQTRALTVPEQRELGDRIAGYAKVHAKRLGLDGVIWWRHVMGFPHVTNPPYRGPYGEWRDYTGPSAHVDHNHWQRDSSPYVYPTSGPAALTPDKVKTVDYVITAKGGLYGLYGPGPAKVKIDAKKRPRGKVLQIAKVVIGKDGRKWGVTAWGTHYLMEYLKKGKTL